MTRARSACGSCPGGRSECQNGHTEVHIPDLMVDDGRPASNARSFGMFYKFLTTCATVYEVLLPRHPLLSTYYRVTCDTYLRAVLSPCVHPTRQLATFTRLNPHTRHLFKTLTTLIASHHPGCPVREGS